MARTITIALLPVLAAVSACSGEPAPAPEPSATPTVATPRTLIPADLDLATLGGRVMGMDAAGTVAGPDGVPIAAASSFVACPKDVAACDPATLPSGTTYTYVVTITPAAAPAEPEPSPSDTDAELAPLEAPAELVRTAHDVPGFNGAVGFARAEATAALGADDALTVTLDQGKLIWRVTGGSGWQPGKPITLWWQSAAPPMKPASAYRLDHGGRQGAVLAALPMADKAVEPPAVH